MKRNVLRIIKLFTGFFVCALGIVMTINANIGFAPWEVFHQGFVNLTGITIGRVSIIVGFILVIIDHVMGEKIGWGTLGNMLFVGLITDFLLFKKLIPTFDGFLPSLIMLLLGAFVLGFGMYLYLDAGLGSGPRDGLMMFLVKRTGKSVRLIKTCVEFMAAMVGYMLGGYIGIGTLIMAMTAGYLTQLAFGIVKFDVSEVQHRFIDDDIRWIKEKLRERAEYEEELKTEANQNRLGERLE